MHVLALSAVTDNDRFWNAMKQAHARLPAGARWTLAIGSTDGTRAVNVIAHDSVEAVRAFLAGYADPFATTEYVEADAANAVGLPA